MAERAVSKAVFQKCSFHCCSIYISTLKIRQQILLSVAFYYLTRRLGSLLISQIKNAPGQGCFFPRPILKLLDTAWWIGRTFFAIWYWFTIFILNSAKLLFYWGGKCGYHKVTHIPKEPWQAALSYQETAVAPIYLSQRDNMYHVPLQGYIWIKEMIVLFFVCALWK